MARSYDVTGALVGKFATQQDAMRAIPPCRTRLDLAKAANVLLKGARCDVMTGARKDRDYDRNKRAESKRLSRHRRARSKNAWEIRRSFSGQDHSAGRAAETSGAEGDRTLRLLR